MNPTLQTNALNADTNAVATPDAAEQQKATIQLLTDFELDHVGGGQMVVDWG